MNEEKSTINALKIEVYDLNIELAKLQERGQELQNMAAEKNAAIKQLESNIAKPE